VLVGCTWVPLAVAADGHPTGLQVSGQGVSLLNKLHRALACHEKSGELLRSILVDPVDALMARTAKHHEILQAFVAVVLISIVVDIERRVGATASLAVVSGACERVPPSLPPLRLLSVFGAHLLKLRGSCSLSEAGHAALLIVVLQSISVNKGHAVAME
jgi:hypothetical protein